MDRFDDRIRPQRFVKRNAAARLLQPLTETKKRHHLGARILYQKIPEARWGRRFRLPAGAGMGLTRGLRTGRSASARLSRVAGHTRTLRMPARSGPSVPSPPRKISPE